MNVAFTTTITGFGRSQGIDRDALRTLVRVAELSGVDSVSLGGLEPGQDVAAIASFILHSTHSLGVLLKHRIGAVPPTIAAQHLATLDQLSGGRVTVAFEPDRPVEGESAEDGLARVDEYLVLLKRMWANDRPIDHEGRFYRIAGAFTAAKPFQRSQVPLVLGGLSGTAIKTAARHADIFALPAGSFEETQQTVERIRAAAQCHRRAASMRFSYPVQPASDPARAAAEDVTRLDGSAEQQALAILRYCDIGITDFHVHGLDTAQAIGAFANGVAALVRRALARHAVHGDHQSIAADHAALELPELN